MNIKSAETDAWKTGEKADKDPPLRVKYRPNLRAHLGHSDYPWQFVIRLEFDADAADGMPSSDQENDLGELENAIMQAIDINGVAVMAFIITQASVREWHFYACDLSEVSQRLSRVLVDKLWMPISLNIDDDANWMALRRVLNQFEQSSE